MVATESDGSGSDGGFIAVAAKFPSMYMCSYRYVGVRDRATSTAPIMAVTPEYGGKRMIRVL